jgi:thiaminase
MLLDYKCVFCDLVLCALLSEAKFIQSIVAFLHNCNNVDCFRRNVHHYTMHLIRLSPHGTFRKQYALNEPCMWDYNPIDINTETIFHATILKDETIHEI